MRMFQVFHMHVASVSCGCCKIGILHICCNGYTCMLQASIPKVSAISYICCPILSGCCICFTPMLQVFYLDVSYIFTHMLQVFHLDVAYVLKWLHMCFSRVSDICCKCLNYFGCMLQMFPLDVAKSRSGVHMLQWTPSTTATCCSFKACLHARGCEGGRSDRHGKLCGRRSRQSGAGHGVGTGHEAVWAPT
jgi:hypothetical protein